jgi:uncharacterized membrane protein HdeD (DUF308 family)
MLTLQAASQTVGHDLAATVLVRSWWMMAIRGMIAVVFGLALLLWPGMTLDRVVVAFAAYALLDGMWGVVCAARVSRGTLTAWPIALGGIVSIALAVMALGWPLVPRQLIHLIAAWGFLTGVLEFIAASRIPSALAARWLLATGGIASIFLAVLIIVLPYAHRDYVVTALGVYALVFGVLLTAAASGSRRGLPPRYEC